MDRLLTRTQLIKRTIIPNNEVNKCTFCAGNNEELLHLLFHCNFFFAVSQQIQVWTDSVGLDEADSIDHFLKCYKLWIGKVEKNKECMICMTTSWYRACGEQEMIVYSNMKSV